MGLPGGEGAFVAGQVHRQRGDFLGRADAAHGLTRDEIGHRLVIVTGGAQTVVQRPALAGVYYYSMALVIMGGLLVSTFLTLVVIPVVYSLMDRRA